MSGVDLEKIAGVEPPVDEAAVMRELEGFMTGWQPAAGEGWRITSLGQADWAMRRVAEARAAAEQYNTEIELWTSARDKVRSATDWFEERLKEWAISQRSKTVKTLRTAHGTIGTRESQPRVGVDDEAAAIAWAKEKCPGAVKVKESLLISEVTNLGRAMVGVKPVAFVAVDKETGEQQRIPVLTPMTAVEASVLLETTRAKMPGYQVDVETVPCVVDESGRPVPGLVVIDGKVTATVTPLGL